MKKYGVAGAFACVSALPIAAALVLCSCGNQATVKATSGAPPKFEPAPDPNVAVMPHPELFQTVQVEMRRVPDELNVSGVVAADVSRTVPVNTLSSGRVASINARLGDFVHKGDLLLTLTSPDLAAAISDYRKAQADEALANKQLERAELLYSKGALAQKDLEVARDSEEKAKVDVQTSA